MKLTSEEALFKMKEWNKQDEKLLASLNNKEPESSELRKRMAERTKFIDAAHATKKQKH